MVVIQRTTAGLKKQKRSTNKIHFKNNPRKEKEFKGKMLPSISIGTFLKEFCCAAI
ncbi:hypothetical protein SJDPG4_09635 [Porphyromonas gingivalis SJD4]|nr:hypothetical protein SJDPG4_09635 [Porphyromonas gingivalis SJD4]